MRMRAQTFVVVAHAFTAGKRDALALRDHSADDLAEYLRGLGRTVALIHHPFGEVPHRCSVLRLFQDGELRVRASTRDYRRLPEICIYIKELLATLVWVLRSGVRWDRYIAADGLSALYGLVLRALRRVHHVTLWNLDFVPRHRFTQRWKNVVYRWVGRFTALRADETWDLTTLMVAERQRLLGLTPARYRMHRVVPGGAWTSRITRYAYSDCDKNTVVFMGYLSEKQGVQQVLIALPEIISKRPDFCLKILGSGPFEANLRALASSLDVDRHVRFLGMWEPGPEMDDEIARSAAGIAPYLRAVDTHSQYGGDPLKVKSYLACGLPVLVTDVVWISTEVERRECGAVISEDPGDIAAKVIHAISDEQWNQSRRENAALYSAEFDYARIFSELDL